MSDLKPEQLVENDRITLIDSKNEEYEFIILEEFSYNSNKYLALAACDEKTDTGGPNDPGEANDITVVRVGQTPEGGEPGYFAVSDPEELYAVAQLIEARFGHLAKKREE